MFDSVEYFDSSDSNVSKIVFKQDNEDRKLITEAVLYKYESYQKRTVICCSVQSGCPMGCTFCGTGNFFIRNLTEDEIVDQVEECILYAQTKEDFDSCDIENFQIMFMSMGEPMLNWKKLKKAIIVLNAMYPNASLLISTAAPRADKAFTSLCKLSRKINKIGLQFSVHESTDEVRDKLVPFKKKYKLVGMSAWGNFWAGKTGRRPFFNYCVHEENNTLEDVNRLVALFPPSIWESTISVICESDETVSASHSRQIDLTSDFNEKMVLAGYNTRIFNPSGQDDIGAVAVNFSTRNNGLRRI